jgi:iron complex outermembrane receptor protein
LLAIEGGYRTQLTKHVSLDSSVFFNNYHRLNSAEPGSPVLETAPAPHIVVPTSFSNLTYGETHGIEVAANWHVVNHWTLSPGYSFLTAHIHREFSGHDLITAAATEGNSPNHQAQLRSQVDLPSRWRWNTSVYFVDRLPAQAIPSYTRVDTNVAWQLAEKFSITLAGENLLKDRHLEYAGTDSAVSSTTIKRTAYAKITWQF